MPTSARTRAVASRGGCGGCEKPFVPPQLQRPPCVKGAVMAQAMTGGLSTAAVAFSATGGAPLQATSARTRRRRVHSTKAPRPRGLVCLRRGTFRAVRSSQNAPGAAAPGPPFRPRGVHPKERHHPGRCASPGRPVPYCLPLPGFAWDSKIAEPLRLRGDSLRPHPLPRNGADYSTRQLLKRHNPSVTASP